MGFVLIAQFLHNTIKMQFSDAYYNKDNNRAGASCALLSMHSDLTHCDLPVAMTTRALSSTSELSRMSLYWRANPESLPGGRAPLLSLIPHRACYRSFSLFLILLLASLHCFLNKILFLHSSRSVEPSYHFPSSHDLFH